MKILMGENFVSKTNDSKQTSYIINESAASKIGFEDPIGKRFSDGTIVGVVKDFNYKSLEQSIEPLILIYSEQTSHYSFLNINVVTSNLAATIDEIEKAYIEVLPKRYLTIGFIDEALELQYQGENKLRKLISVFSSLAILIACIGLFSLSSLKAIKGRKQVSVRKVFGASFKNVYLFFIKDFSLIVITSTVMAIPVAYVLINQWLSSYQNKLFLSFEHFLIPISMVFFIAWLIVSYHTFMLAKLNPVKYLREE